MKIATWLPPGKPLPKLFAQQPDAPPPDSFEPGFGRRLSGAAVGVIAAPALGLGLAALPRVFLPGPGASVPLAGGVDALVQFAGTCSLPLLALGAGIGLAGGIAVATAGQSGGRSTLAAVLGAAGLALGAVGGASAGWIGLGAEPAMIGTLVGGVAGAIAGYALGDGR